MMKLLKNFLKFWKKLGEFNSRIVLGIVYIIVFGITKAILLASKKRLLELTIDNERKSYWQERKKQKITADDMKRGF